METKEVLANTSKGLKEWFSCEKRLLPWRGEISPYGVWVSEVMLQQTQVAVVIPYFERWMERFPTIVSLAQAELDEVIKMWEGLGYYSRARNLHKGAQQVVDKFSGELPRSWGELETIKGLGPYTIGAILSFAFQQKVAAVDGNVIRVLTRFYGIRDDIAKQSTVRVIREKANALLPDDEPWVVTEALIELGAKVCKKSPECGICPLQSSCLAFRLGIVSELPYKSKRVAITPLYRAVAVIECDNHFLIQRGKEGKIMSDLHEFPYFETSPKGILPSDFSSRIQDELGLEVEYEGDLVEVSHSFTRYRVRLSPAYFVCKTSQPPPNMFWRSRSDLSALAFSSGHRKLLQQLERVNPLP